MDEALYKMELRKMYCNNCGQRGHVFRVCADPIISCGVILINSPKLPVKPADVKMLMVRRKDSMAYTEFLRGKYDPALSEYVIKLLSNMTASEHDLLLTVEFSELWTRHWGVGHDHHSREYDISKERFETLDISNLIKGLVGYSESEWGFPKGRRAHRESDYDCALREFSEETNISRETFVVCRNLLLTESFSGTNGIPYKHVYFIALLRSSIDITQDLTTIQKREVSAIEWKTIPECRTLTRRHYIQRPEMLDSLERILDTFDIQDNIAFNQE